MTITQHGPAPQEDILSDYAQLVATIGGIFWEADSATLQFTQVSEQAISLLGYPIAQWLTENFWLAHLHPADRDWVSALCTLAINEQRSQSFDARMIAADGRAIWFRNSIMATKTEDAVTKVRGLMVNITDYRKAKEEQEAHLWVLECMDQINRAIQGTNDLEEQLQNTIDTVFAIFKCDRVWLICPDDPLKGSSYSVVEFRPSTPHSWAQQRARPTDPIETSFLQTVIAADGPLIFGPQSSHPLPAQMKAKFGIQSTLATALTPQNYAPFLFGLHQCTAPRVWTSKEERLFQEIGRRLSDALTSLLTHRRLQEKELRYREVFENTSDLIALTEVTEEGRFRLLDFNPAWEALMGIESSPLIGRYLDEFSANEIVNAALLKYQACLKSQIPITYEGWMSTPSGRWYMHNRLVPIYNTDGRVYRVVGMGRNITQQKEAQEELGLFRTLIDHINDAIEIIDPETGRFLDVNEQACLAHGFTREEYLTLTVPQLYPQIAERPWAEVLEEERQAGFRVFESEHQRKDGSVYPVELNTNYIRLDRDYLLAVVRDITERKRTEQALLENHTLLNTLINNTLDAVFVKDTLGRYLLINRAGAAFLGKQRAEVIGQDDTELFAPESAHIILERDRMIMATGEAQMIESKATANGITRTYLTTKNAFRNAHGEVIGLIGISRDITELKRLEEQFRQIQKMDALGRLAGGVAHDFNNLLTVINGYSELILRQMEPGAPRYNLIAEIQKAGLRGAALTRQLLAFSRKQILQPQVVNLNHLLADLVTMLRRLIGKNIELKLVSDDRLGLTKIDQGQFEQVIINLAVNARDAMPTGGQLLIETYNIAFSVDTVERDLEISAGRYVCVMVCDDGLGMDEETQSRLFEPFFTTKPPGEGTGLGLAMVYGFVKQSGGQIKLFSKPGVGSSFTIYLPLTNAPPSATEPTTNLQERPLLYRDETILLVEDEDSVRALVGDILRAQGYHILEAREPANALQLAATHTGNIDLLLTDMMMPQMDGRELAQELLATHADLKILYMSGYTEDTIFHQPPLTKSTPFLQKPFTIDSLLDKVRTALA